MSEKPENQNKKPQSKKAKKLNINPRKHWLDIVNNVDKKEVPIHILQEIKVSLFDGTTISIDIKQLLESGEDPDAIEQMLDDKFNQLDKYIQNVDFLIDIEKVVNTVQPETDKVLKNL